MKRKNLNKILMVSLLSFLSIYVGCNVYNANASPNSQVNVTVPSNVSVVFNEDGTNTVSNYNITNNSLVPITVDNINLSSKNGWSIVPSGSKILRDTKSLSLSLFDKWLKEGDNNMSVVINENSNKNLSPLVERGAWTKEVTESAFDLSISYDIGKKDFTLSFDTSGGNDVKSIVAKNGDSVTLPSATKKGYTFTGWLDSNGVIHNAGSSYTMPIGGDELVAQWRVNKLYIQFHMNGGSLSDKVGSGISTKGDLITYKGSTYVQTFSYGETMTSTGLSDYNNPEFINISKLGYIAPSGAQWNTSFDGTGTSYDQYFVYKVSDLADLSNGDVTLTLYVNWKPITYTINFDGNYGTSGSTSSMKVDYDSSVNLSLNGFSKDAHTFTNWNTHPYGTGTSYSNEQEIKNLSNKNGDTITLYAQWEPNGISFNFKPNNGESDYSLDGVLGDMYDLTTPSKTGYDFSGWNKSDYYGLFGKYNRINTFTDGTLTGIEVYKYGYADSNLFGNLEIVNASDDNPTNSDYEVKITATAAYPIDGVNRYVGFCTTGNTTPEKSYVHTFKAKIPKGVKVEAAHNSLGTGGEIHWYTEQYGTGEWETYSYIAELGPNSEGYAIGYVYIASVDSSVISVPFSWNLAYSKIMEVTNVTTDPVLLLGSKDNTLTAKWTPKKYKVNFDENYIENNLYNTFYDLGYWDFNSTIDSSNSSFSIKEDSSLDSGRYVEISLGTTLYGSHVGGYYYGGDKLEAGKTYTWSVNIKASRSGVLSQIGDEQNGLVYDVNVGTEWKTIRHTFTAQDTPHGSFTFYYSSTGSFQQGDKIYVSNLQLMEGSPSVLTEVKDYGSKLGVLPTITREGYTFLGWYTGINSGDKTSSDAIVSVDNSTYYARWSPNDNIKYRVNHYQMNLDGSTYSLVETENKTGISNKNLELRSLKKYYTGFTYENGKVNNKVVSSVNINPDGSTIIDLYYSRNKVVLDINAIVDGKVYGVGTPYMTYDLTVNGVKVQTQAGDGYDLVYYGSNYEVSNINARPGYSYAGVKTGVIEGQGNGYDLKGTVTDTSRHGVFLEFNKINYSISYDLDGGTNPSDAKTSYTIGTDYILPTPNKTGYSFLGWNEFYQMSDWNPGDLGNNSVVGGAVVESNRGAYYSEYIPVKAGYTYSWTAYANGHTVGARFYDSNYSYKYYATDDNDSYTPSENGYMRFLIVNYSEGSEDYLKVVEKSPSGYITSIKPTDIGDRNFIANWQANTYYLDVNGLLDGKSSSNITGYGTFDVYINGILTAQGVSDYYAQHPYGTTYEIKNIVQSVGHTYVGLSHGVLKSTIGASNVGVGLSFNTNTYKVVYNSNGGSGITSTSTHKYGEAKNLTANRFTRTGYSFAGWATSASGSVVYNNSQSVSNLTATNNGTVNLYAKWTPNTNTKYVVRHYQMNLDGVNYTLVETENKTGTSDSSITVSNLKKTYTGFTYVNGKVGSNVVTTTTVAPDGSRVIDLYYSRNTYYLNLNGFIDGVGYSWLNGAATADVYVNGKLVLANATDYYTKHFYGSTFEIKNIKVKDGYTYKGVYVENWTYADDVTGTISDSEKRIGLNFETINYSITYNLNGGSISSTPNSYKITSEDFTLPTPSRTGYLFSGWTGSNGSTPQTSVSIVKGSTGNKSYTANWTPKKLTTTFYRNLDSSDTTTAQQVFTYATTGQSFSAKGWTKTGYTQLGWADSRTATTQQYSTLSGVADSWIESKYPSNNIYAIWRPNNYTIAFKTSASGASGTTPNISAKYDTSYTLTANGFTRPGYTFTGWNTKEDGSGVSYTDKQSVKNLTSTNGGVVNLYAQWKPNTYTYNIVYKSSTGKSLGTSTVSGTFGSSKSVSAPAKTGYTAPSAQTVVFDSTSAKTITFTYPIVNYSIAYNLNGGSVSGNPTSYNIESSNITLKNPSKVGNSFTGWTGSNGSTVQTSVSIPSGSTGNKSYTANWKVNTYTLTFNANGGSTPTSSKSVAYGSAYGTLPTPSRTNYTFKGWFTSASGGTQVNANTVMGDGNVTLYAQWTLNSYTLTINTVGGSISNKTFSFTNGQAMNLPTPSLWGFDFSHYINEADSTIVSSTGTFKWNSNVTLRAVYKPSATRVVELSNGTKLTLRKLNLGFNYWDNRDGNVDRSTYLKVTDSSRSNYNTVVYVCDNYTDNNANAQYQAPRILYSFNTLGITTKFHQMDLFDVSASTLTGIKPEYTKNLYPRLIFSDVEIKLMNNYYGTNFALNAFAVQYMNTIYVNGNRATLPYSLNNAPKPPLMFMYDVSEETNNHSKLTWMDVGSDVVVSSEYGLIKEPRNPISNGVLNNSTLDSPVIKVPSDEVVVENESSIDVGSPVANPSQGDISPNIESSHSNVPEDVGELKDSITEIPSDSPLKNDSESMNPEIDDVISNDSDVKEEILIPNELNVNDDLEPSNLEKPGS